MGISTIDGHFQKLFVHVYQRASLSKDCAREVKTQQDGPTSFSVHSIQCLHQAFEGSPMTNRSALGDAFYEVLHTKFLQIPLHSQPDSSSEKRTKTSGKHLPKMTKKLINQNDRNIMFYELENNLPIFNQTQGL